VAGPVFRLDDHIDRLLGACRKIRLEPPLDKDQIRDVMNEVVIRSGLRDAYVEIIVTRGVPGPGERDPRRWTPHVYAYAIPYVWIVRPEDPQPTSLGLFHRVAGGRQLGGRAVRQGAPPEQCHMIDLTFDVRHVAHARSRREQLYVGTTVPLQLLFRVHDA
jgi:hypothetical protein